MSKEKKSVYLIRGDSFNLGKFWLSSTESGLDLRVLGFLPDSLTGVQVQDLLLWEPIAHQSYV